MQSCVRFIYAEPVLLLSIHQSLSAFVWLSVRLHVCLSCMRTGNLERVFDLQPEVDARLRHRNIVLWKDDGGTGRGKKDGQREGQMEGQYVTVCVCV